VKLSRIGTSVLVCALWTFSPADASAQTFLKIPGINGPSQVVKHVGEFETLNCTFTVTAAPGAGASSAARAPHSVTVTLLLGPESLLLLNDASALKGPSFSAIKTAFLSFLVKDARGAPEPKEIVVKLNDAVITEARVDSGTGIFNGTGAVVTLTFVSRSEEFAFQ